MQAAISCFAIRRMQSSSFQCLTLNCRCVRNNAQRAPRLRDATPREKAESSYSIRAPTADAESAEPSRPVPAPTVRVTRIGPQSLQELRATSGRVNLLARRERHRSERSSHHSARLAQPSTPTEVRDQTASIRGVPPEVRARESSPKCNTSDWKKWVLDIGQRVQITGQPIRHARHRSRGSGRTATGLPTRSNSGASESLSV